MWRAKLINKIKSLTNTEDKKRLMSNFFSLSVLQGANYILPLITLPYLVRVLGVEYFGLLAFATATVTYFSILTDYGFNLTATKEISIHRDNKAKVIEIFSSVMTIKVILMFVSFLLLTILVFSFEKFSQDALVYFLTFGIVVGQVLFPVWFFQGMERMKYITYLNLAIRLIYTVAIFIFIHEASDFYLVPAITSFGYILVGIWSIMFIKKEFEISFKFQSLNIIKNHFKDGWDVFVSRIFVSLYTSINIFLLGLFSNNTVVGYYAIAERVVQVASGLFVPANQTIYPYMAKMFETNKDKFYNFTKKISIIFLIFGIFLFLIFGILGEVIVELITGGTNQNILSIYYILIFTLITAPFGPLFSQGLIIEKRNKEFMKIVRNTFVLNLIVAPVLIYFYNGIGLAITVSLIQILHILYLILIYRRKAFEQQ